MEEKHSGTVFNLAQVINPLYTHEGSKADNELVIKAQVSLLEFLIELENDFCRAGDSCSVTVEMTEVHQQPG